MQTDLSITRIGMAEHAYPTPTRNILSEQQRTRKRSMPKAGEVRIGRRLADGTEVFAPSQREQAEILANRQMDKRLHEERMQALLAGHTVEIDSWAHKS